MTDPNKPPVDPSGWHPDTIAVRAATQRSQFGEHSEALFLTSSFTYENAAQAAARFKGEEPGPVYSRFTNPTVAMFEQRLAAMERMEAGVATATGMSAILACAMALCAQGDHIVSSRSLFGSTYNLFAQLMARFGVSTTFVGQNDLDAWRAAVTPKTKFLYVETPSNPLLEVADVAALAEIARGVGAELIVDNCFCTPALQRPAEYGASIVLHSATKFLEGQGRVLAGAILARKQLIEEKFIPYMRTAGPALSAFNAWLLLKSMETLSARMEKQSRNAQLLAERLAGHPGVKVVNYPGLPTHPQHALAMRMQNGSGGALLSFEVTGGREHAWRVIDAVKICSITGNLGDTRTTITHPATTTHARLTQEARDAAGIREGLVRLSVGLEYVEDLWADVSRSL
ncbi:MAG TPA: O-succinylhomoserine sulfhydrylase [Burkholderiaceae bacterium]|nr:O-succinylhomoserine sulfhydrylase [Burkholderiaceae bacterium]